MKTRYFGKFNRIRPPQMIRISASAVCCVFLFTGGIAVAASEDASLREYETFLREKKRDFERFVKYRDQSSQDEEVAAEALRASRKKDEEQQAELEQSFVRQMKRYSMEETEARDREDEERVAKESKENDEERRRFAKLRDQKRDLKESIAPVDPYRELEINMAVPPESKATPVESKGSQLDKNSSF